MKIYEWKEGMTPEEAKDIGYWERNMLALLLAKIMNVAFYHQGIDENCGWYFDFENNWDGWKRVISIGNGSITFHIPDDFDVGSLKQIKPNWDKHTTKKKWTDIMMRCGCKID